MIDDDESLADAIAQHLIKQHYAVDIATNGQMGLEFVALFNYDLIILDLMLPDLSGRKPVSYTHLTLPTIYSV